MENMTKLSKRKGVSPVIATVILVAVTITVAVAVAYWMSGIAGQYTSFEKIEIQSATITPLTNSWEVLVKLKNTGTKTSTLISVFVNEEEAFWDTAAPGATTATITSSINATTPEQILSGATGTVNVWIGTNGTLSSGTTVNIKIHSAGGMDYPKLVQLP